ncbi:MAG: amino acid ABC transporter permease [Clostridia bacterium]|nr:amino acid ABC transporter permease [Clostridia bacterium]
MSSALDNLKSQFILNFVEKDRWRYFVSGLGVTLRITLFAVLIGIVLGTLVAIVRSTGDKLLPGMRKGPGRIFLGIANGLCKIYLTVIRGTPVVIQLMISYYIIFASSRNGVLIAIIAFGINSGAYVAEIVRAGIMSVDNGQMEAGRSLGFTFVQTMAYIIIPQAFKNVLPSLANEFIVLLKETSVAGYVAVRDLTKAGDIVRGTTYSAFMPLIGVALVYLILVVFFSWLVGKLERRLRASDH